MCNACASRLNCNGVFQPRSKRFVENAQKSADRQSQDPCAVAPVTQRQRVAARQTSAQDERSTISRCEIEADFADGQRVGRRRPSYLAVGR